MARTGVFVRIVFAVKSSIRGFSRTPSMILTYMNTASKLGPHTQTDRGTCPGVGL
jgi:hypothetical protein